MRFNRRPRKTSTRHNARPRGRFLPGRIKTLEVLESREMLAGDVADTPWHNSSNPADVNFDQRVSPIDALVIINDLLANGSHAIDVTAVAPLSTTLDAGRTYFRDTSGDNRVTPLDLLIVINELVDEELMLVHTFPTDMSDNPITTISVGTQFKLRTEVRDIRDPVAPNPGVFAAGVDVSFSSSLFSIDTGQTVQFDPFWNLIKQSSLTASRAITYGAAQTQPNTNEPQFLSSVVLTATNAGMQAFMPVFDATLDHDYAIVGNNDSLTSDQIQFVGAMLEITGTPSLSISSVTQDEDSGNFNFTVTLSGAAPTENVTVAFTTSDGSGANPATVANDDYEFTSGTLTFTPGGATTMVIPVTVNADLSVEPDEVFNVTLSNVSTNATIGAAVGIGTILNDDTLATLAIGSVAQNEDTPGTFDFMVTISGEYTQNVTVNFSTNDGSGGNAATVADNDYEFTSGTLTFTPGGATTMVIPVTVNADSMVEPNEVFNVVLSNPSVNATIGSPLGIGTILNDDGAKVALRLELADLTETPLPINAVLAVGDEFLLRVFVTDVTPEPTGVFQTALDVTFQSQLVEPIGGLEFGESFDTLSVGTVGDGVLDDVKAVTTAPPTDPSAELLVFEIQFKAIATGLVDFVGIALNDEDADLVTRLFFPAPETPVPVDEINVENRSIQIGSNGLIVSNEAEQESNNIVFHITRFLPDNTTATVMYSTANGTAFAGDDYVFQSGTLTFVPGQPTTQTVTVEVINDTTDEPDETMLLVLSNAVNAVAGIPGTGTILDDDDEVSVSASNPSAEEGENLVFTVSLSAVSGKTVIVNYATGNPASGIVATAGVDYTPTSGVLTFSPGITQQQVTVASLEDFEFEPDETFQLVFSDAQNATLGTSGLGTIINDDAPSVLSISDAMSQAEDSLTPFSFEVSLSKPAMGVVTVTFMTSDGSSANGATAADNDYEPTTGILTFLPGQTVKTVLVTVNSDDIVEPNESFNVILSNPSPEVALGTSVGVGTILNDDPPALQISDAVVGAGPEPTIVDFTVTLSQPFTEEVTVGFATEADTALEGIDYEAQTGNLVFLPGVTSKLIHVTVLANTTPQPSKTFFMNLSSQTPEGVAIEDARGVGTIITQGLSISDAVVVEGNSSTTNAVFTVTLSRMSSETVTVFYSTADDTATIADSDYVAKSGTLTFAPGTASQMITVSVIGDMQPEGNERFLVNLSAAVGAPLFDSRGIGTILNDDGAKVLIRLELADLDENPLPIDTPLNVGNEFYLQVFIRDVTPEPTGVFQTALDVTFDANVVAPVGELMFSQFYSTFTAGTVGDGVLDDVIAWGQFTPPSDPSAELLVFKMQFKAISQGLVEFVGIALNDENAEPNELVTRLYGPAPETPVPVDEINVVNRSINIGSNVLTVSNVSAPESNNLVFEITRFLPDNNTATVVYSTGDGTAKAGQDYVAQSGTLTFVPGQPTKQFVTVTVINDTIDEPDETMSLILSDPVGASVGSPGTGTIQDDDVEVSVSASNPSAFEGENLVFTVSLSAVSGKQVTVNYTTADPASGIPATAGLDYTPTSGTLTFSAGITQKQVTVALLEDFEFESSETFRLVLSEPDNASLGSQGLGTILDVPPAGISGFVFVDLNNNGIKEGNETGIPGAIVTATRQSDGFAESTMTGQDGSYVFGSLFPDTYTITQTQPGFYADGRDVHLGVESTVNDQYSGVVLVPSARETGYNFGEQGVRSEFIAAFINRRALFASAVVGGLFGPTLNMPGTTLDLHTGDIWVSFDGGWDGLRTIEATFDASQGSASMKLYNNSLQVVALSAPTTTGAVLLFNGQIPETYFLRLSGSNADVTVQISDSVLPSAFSTPGDGGDANQDGTPAATNSSNSNSDTLSPASRFASAQLMIEPESDPLVSSDASDEALSEDADWILETLLA